MVALFQNRKAVVDRMRPCKTAAFKADAAEVSVSFDNTLQRIGHHASLRSKACLLAFHQQGIIAQARQAQRRHGGLSARHAGRSGVITGFRFKPGRERIAHPGHQQTYRRFGNDRSVHHHHIRVFRVDQILFKLTGFGIDNGQRAGWRIGRRDSRDHHHRQLLVVTNRFGGIQRFPAANPNHAATTVLFQNGNQSINFNMATFTVKAFRMAANVVAVQAVEYFLSRQLHHEVIRNHKKAVRQIFSVLTKQGGSVRTLEIFGWRLNNF